MTDKTLSPTRYWTEEIEQKAIQLTESDCDKERNRLYMQIREPLLMMIDGIMRKRQVKKDIELLRTDIETRIYMILTTDKFDSDKGRVYSYITRAIWNEITANWKKQFQQKNRNDSIEAEEFYLELADKDPEIGKEHHHIIDELEGRLIYLVPFHFPQRKKDMITIYECMYSMIEIFRENEINRVRAFKKEVLNRVPNANPNMITKLIKLMREEYQRIKDSGY